MKILVAVEDNMFGKALFDFISAHCWSEETHFRVVHIVEPIFWGAYGGAVSPDALSQMVADSERFGKTLTSNVAQMIKQKFPNHEVEEVVGEGNPKDEILLIAKEWPADMILMGSHGRKGLSRLLLGSVSMSISSLSPCSVIIIKPTKSQMQVQLNESQGKIENLKS
jgi:nucleotide-binding universal stress UspA family protein